MIGKKFGKLTVIKKQGVNKYGQALYLCRCTCGGKKTTLKYRLECGDTKTCGCYKHGRSDTSLYSIWNGIKKRCVRGEVRNIHRYKNRGVLLYDRWLDFLTFEKWAKDNGYRKGLQIDRIDNNKGYEPKNCRFVDAKTNSQNQERCKYWVVNGNQYNSSRDAAAREGVSKVTVQRWCKGYFSNPRNKFYPPKAGCYTVDKYNKEKTKCKQ